MRKNKAKNQSIEIACSAGQAITVTNWDKHSTWEALGKKLNIKPWPESKLSGTKKTKK